ncbi:LA_0442/LA_0875 N-terminal domain-containing protein [Leptospira sarikeiensis]|uniref:DUF5683 domain-containing protein n=1 Tax=Leptospira sarikeiensis TaxID=2484943 RepID=A0A4R9K824_9LEPT|nr:hypothetical protein [Leptospira sarikeiensis]TGL60774.1 hypothetical protein EHQ64_13245 [Leptospira sarikeiensis]
MPYRWLFAICFLTVTTSIFGSSLTLKNGKVLNGKVVNQTRTEVQIEVDGKVLTIPKTEIAELNLKDTPKQEVKKDPVKPKEEPKKTEEEVVQRWYQKPRWNYTLKSAVVPGWGIWKGEKKYVAAAAFVAVVGIAYKVVDTQQDFSAARNDYKSNATNYFAFALQDPVLSLPANTPQRLIGAFLVNKGSFNHYQNLAGEGNNYQYLLGIAYGLQLFYSYYLGVKAEQGAAEGPSSGFRFSFAPSYQPMTVGGNGLGWNGELKYEIRY